MHCVLTWFLQFQRYKSVINQGGHPIALVSMVTMLWETRLYKNCKFRFASYQNLNFRLPNSCFLLESGYCRTAVFQYRTHEWTFVQLIKISRLHPRIPPSWRCSFAFFVFFIWHFSEKLLADVIFKSSGLVLWNNQENGTEKQWNLHPHLTVRLKSCDLQKKKKHRQMRSNVFANLVSIITGKRCSLLNEVFFITKNYWKEKERWCLTMPRERNTNWENRQITQHMPSLTFCTISFSISNSLWCKFDERFRWE